MITGLFKSFLIPVRHSMGPSRFPENDLNNGDHQKWMNCDQKIHKKFKQKIAPSLESLLLPCDIGSCLHAAYVF